MLSALRKPEQSKVAEAVAEFAADDSGRSVAIESVRGPQILAEARAGEPRPAASLVKLPLVAAVYESARAGRLDLDAQVRRGELTATAYATVLEAFHPERALTLRELCMLVLITSDNPASEHLIQLVGIDAVNRTARRFGCTSTRMEVGFSDAHLDEGGARNLTTARDALALVRGAVAESPEIENALVNSLRNTRVPLRLPPWVRVAHKTGTLLGVANDVGIVQGERVTLAVSFLCEGQPDTAVTSVAIGDCVARIWAALGERLA
jgi:beta-lactamase class A